MKATTGSKKYADFDYGLKLEPEPNDIRKSIASDEDIAAFIKKLAIASAIAGCPIKTFSGQCGFPSSEIIQRWTEEWLACFASVTLQISSDMASTAALEGAIEAMEGQLGLLGLAVDAIGDEEKAAVKLRVLQARFEYLRRQWEIYTASIPLTRVEPTAQ